MPSPAERIIDETVAHRIALSRYSNATVRKALAALNRTDQALVDRILRADNEGRDIRQLERMLEEVRALQADGWAVLRSRLVDDLDGLAEAERDFAAKIARFGQRAAGVTVATNIPTTAQVVAAVNSRPFQGRFLKGWMDEAEAGAAKRVRETLRQGFIEGRSVADLVKQIRGTKALQFRDGILEGSRRGTEAMVRTAITHTASRAAEETYRAMGVASKVRWIATLDSRTTLVCAGRHNKTFPLDIGPRPPAHVNCRSTLAPVVDGLPEVPAPSYAEWLERQPEAVQNDILGVAKARLFRDGNLTLDRFTDRNGRALTLAELRKRDGQAFAD